MYIRVNLENSTVNVKTADKVNQTDNLENILNILNFENKVVPNMSSFYHFKMLNYFFGRCGSYI